MTSNIAGRFTVLSDRPPLQTFIAPSRAYPIALSVLWVPAPKLAPELLERATVACAGSILSKPGFAADVNSAIEYLLQNVVDRERSLNWAYMHFFSSSLEEPLESLKDYDTLLHDIWIERPKHEHLTSYQIVISRSPPTEELLGKLLATGTIGLGVYTGLSIVPEAANPFMLMSCVAGGIICISTATGIGRALQDGLYERVYGLLKNATKEEKKPHPDK
jgi:hypothetical protein